MVISEITINEQREIGSLKLKVNDNLVEYISSKDGVYIIDAPFILALRKVVLERIDLIWQYKVRKEYKKYIQIISNSVKLIYIWCIGGYEKMEKGDIIRVSIARKVDMGPEHFGIFDGDRGVYHFQGKNAKSARIKWTTLREFEEGGYARVYSYYDKKYSPNEIVNRASSKITTDFGGYNLRTNNCEHFATWCATGVRQSMQTGHVNPIDDERDIVERNIDNTMRPFINSGDRIDKVLGWGDYNEGEKSVGEEVFETVFIKPLDKAIEWLDRL